MVRIWLTKLSSVGMMTGYGDHHHPAFGDNLLLKVDIRMGEVDGLGVNRDEN
jgi:hypothetical protein